MFGFGVYIYGDSIFSALHMYSYMPAYFVLIFLESMACSRVFEPVSGREDFKRYPLLYCYLLVLRQSQALT